MLAVHPQFLCLHITTPASRLQQSIPPVYQGSAAHIHHSIVVGLRFATLSHCSPCSGRANPSKLFSFSSTLHSSTPTRPEHGQSSRAPYLYAFTSTRLRRVSRAPELHTSTSAHLQHDSRAPELHTSTFARPQGTSTVQYSLPPCPHTYIAPPELYSSAPTGLQRSSQAPELHSSHLQGRGTLPELPRSIPLSSARLWGSGALFLHTYTPTARLWGSRAPFLYAYTLAARL